MPVIMASLHNIAVALIMSTAITYVDAAISFLPGRSIRLPFTIQNTSNTRCNISVLRCGHSDNDDNTVAGYAVEASASQIISEKNPANSLDVEVDDAPTTADNNDATTRADQDVVRTRHDLVVEDGSSMESEPSAKSERKTAGTNTTPSQHEGAWEEEIRRTREYYSTSSRTDNILIAGSTSKTARENIDDEGLVNEVENYVGIAQTTNYNTIGEIMESSQGKLEEAETVATPTNAIDDSDRGGTEERKTINQQSPELESEVVHTPGQNDVTADVPAIHTSGNIEEEEVFVQESVDTSTRDETYMLPKNETNDAQTTNCNIIEETMESSQGKLEEAETVATPTNAMNDSHHGGIEERKTTNQQSPKIESEVVDTSGQNDATADVPVIHAIRNIEEEEVFVQESIGTSSRDEIYMPPKNEANDQQLPSDEEKDAGQEELAASEEMKDVDSDESGTIFPIQEEGDVDNAEVTTERSSDDNAANKSVANESGREQLQSVAADTKESHLEGLIATTHGQQEISPISNKIELKNEDLLDIHRWQKTSTPLASNKLVDEGLRRLQRRDGDRPSVPYVITRAMKKMLIDELGYDPLEVNRMRPDVAVVIVAESLERPDLEVLPSRFYNDEEPAIAVKQDREDKSVKGAVVSLFRRLQNGVWVALAGRDPKSTVILVTSLGVALSLLLRPTHDNKKAWEVITPTSDFPSQVEVPPNNVKSGVSDIDENLDESDKAPSASESQLDDLDKT